MSTILTEALIQILKPYNELLGELTDEQIAEQLELETSIVTAYRDFLVESDDDGASKPERLQAGTDVDTVSTSEAIPTASGGIPAELAGALSEESKATEERVELVNKVAQDIGAVLTSYAETGKTPSGKELAPALCEALCEAVCTALGASNNITVTVKAETVDNPSRVAVAMESALARVSQSTRKERPPRSVRVKKKATIKGPSGRPWVLGYRDIYSGEQAAWLWAHHCALVERYPAR